MPTRRESLVLGFSLLTGLAGCTGTDGSDSTTEAGNRDETVEATLQLETVTDRPESPLAFDETPAGRYYVADRPGQIYLLNEDSSERALDLSGAIRTGSERGLLGLALHPQFGSNGLLYVRYSSPPRKNTPDSYSHTFVLSEFHARGDGTIDQGSERILLTIPEPQGNHNSGPIAFGPDGYLYVGVGDGGAGDDIGRGHVEDWYEANDGGNGQDVQQNLLGSLLRIDVDDRSGEKPYGIPPDNPLVGSEGHDEHYAWGLRNPWGISFDGTALYVADVGQNRFEEVNLIRNGGNYGWNVKEGTNCFRADSCPGETPDGTPLRGPVVQYPHSGDGVTGNAVVGGHIYRGSKVSTLQGQYVFGDVTANGKLFAATPTEERPWPTEILEVDGGGEQLQQLLLLERGANEELYALTPGGVYRLVSS